MHTNAINLTGQRFGKLTVISEAGRNKDGDYNGVQQFLSD